MKNELQAKIQITIIGAIVNIALALAKVVVGIIAHSHALVIDGIHSISDLVTDVLVIVVSKLSNQEPDQQHPYGHKRFETVGTVILGSILIAVAGAIIYDSTLRILSPNIHVMPSWPAIVIAAVSILAKEIIYRYTIFIGKKTKSEILIANAWHHRSDALSSLVVLIGIAGAMMGFLWLDQVAALVVAFFIAKIGWELAWKNIVELVDTAPSADIIQNIESLVLHDENVCDIHNLRCRKMGGQIILDIHIEVAPYVSVSEGHNIGDWITHELLSTFSEIHDITVHIDYENSDTKDLNDSTQLLPLRSDVLDAISSRWEHIIDFDKIKHINLHYNHAKINIELICPFEYQKINIKEQIYSLNNNPEWLGEIELWYYSD